MDDSPACPVLNDVDIGTTTGSSDVVVKDPMFYFDHVVFKVDNTLFKVPKAKFTGESQVFEDMFTLPSPGPSAGEDRTPQPEGMSDERPIVLEGVKLEDFRALLRVMFRPHHGASEGEAKEATVEEWISVLRLTTMWQLNRLRDVAVRNLTPELLQSNPVLWIVLARQYDIKHWLLPALHALARREEPLRLEDVEQLGIPTMLRMAEVRESYGLAVNAFQRCGRSAHNFEPVIRRVFREQLPQEPSQELDSDCDSEDVHTPVAVVKKKKKVKR